MNKETRTPPVLQAQKVTKIFSEGPQKVVVLSGVDFTLQRGERVAILGTSGSGKSTLLHLLGGLDQPSEGKVFVGGQAFSQMSDAARAQLRNRSFGFVYQFHHLLPEFTALENVAMPLLLRANLSIKQIEEKAGYLLEKVGLKARLRHKPSELSGGERQRVAIARALVGDPHCVFADEPTGNLDTQTAQAVMQLFLNLNQEFKTSFVIVTHDLQIANQMERKMVLKNGILSVME
jgi:lipoprotein-releasing system ATP-binding protein